MRSVSKRPMTLTKKGAALTMKMEKERRKRLATKRRLCLAEGMPYLMEFLPCDCMRCVRDALNVLWPPGCPLQCSEEKRTAEVVH